MFEQRNLKVDICALGLLALTTFLGFALLTYHKTDPPGTLVYPVPTSYQNACGVIGAFAAHNLFTTLGIGAYYAVGSLAILTIILFKRREIDQPVLRAGGWIVSLVGLTAFVALAIPNFSPGPVVGSGGYVGAIARNLLEQHFAQAGAYIFTITVLLAGLLLCTDYVLLKVAALTTIFSGRGLVKVGQLSHAAALRRRRRSKIDGENSDEPPEETAGETWVEEEDDAEWDDEELDQDTEDEDQQQSPRKLKIRTPTEKETNASKPAQIDNTTKPQNQATTQLTLSGVNLANGLKSALGMKGNSTAPSRPAPPKTERDKIIEKLEAADHEIPGKTDYELPSLDLLLANERVSYKRYEREVRQKAHVLEKTFKNFGFNIRVAEVETGPVIAQYEVQLEAGLRLSKITSLSDDLAIALRVPSVRIVAPIPGKNTVGIEVPNENRQIVRLREVIEESNGRTKRMKIPIYLGKDVAGRPMVVDLTSLPHLLIAGRTGTGKSVCLNSIIVSMLMGRGPDEVRLLMVDPKMVELSGYRKLPHLMHPVVTDMQKAEAILSWAVDKMEERYQLLARAGVRHVSVFNQLGDEELRERVRPKSETEWEQIPRQLPYVVIVADELADLMMTSGKDVEQHIIRLAQKSRAVGIHLILATQKPTVDVITGLIKSNLPARIAFQVASRTDSRVVLDESGAEKLLGNGDMLFLSPGSSTLFRGQGTFLSDDEISNVVDFVGTDDPQFAHELLELKTKDEKEAATADNFKNRDELYEAAVDVVVRERRGSVSLLQRTLGIGYGRAARLIDFMAEDGVVGEYNGAQAREVLVSLQQWEDMNAPQDPDQQGSTTAPSSAAENNSVMDRNKVDLKREVTSQTVAPLASQESIENLESESSDTSQNVPWTVEEETEEEDQHEEDEYEEEGEEEEHEEYEDGEEDEYEDEEEDEYEDEEEGEYEDEEEGEYEDEEEEETEEEKPIDIA
ncbi:MAG: DNA translocase FtsK 4TM domain-containing protein [Pirellulales bacterium]|nr:DNA translocase FtsK 4TM domain-containing protein [Pirellulales bacterium]